MPIFTQKKTAFGFDLSDFSVKMLQLDRSGNDYKVLGYTDYPLPKGVVVNDVVADENALMSHVKNAMAKMKYGSVNTSQIIASIPEPKAFVRVIQIPKMTEEQAANAVPFEAEQYIPIPIEQVYLDWVIIREGDEKMDVLVTAAGRDYIDNYLRVLKRIGFQPLAFEVESAACARALIPQDKNEKAIMIMDMSNYRTSLIVSQGGNLEFTSSVPIAGDSFTQSIARALGVNVDQAEKIKREFGLDDAKEHQNVKAALTPVIDNLINEVRNMIKFHNDHSQTPISQIILCGGSSKLLHLNSYMYQKLTDYSEIDIVLGNPWVNVYDGKSKNLPPLDRDESLGYTTALGLALRGANVNK